jgi:RNA polymerase sigma factor (TIGR02999 family)
MRNPMTEPDISRQPAPTDAPAPQNPGAVTSLLRAHRAGDQDAYAQLFPLLYDHLQSVARTQLRRDARGQRGLHTLSTTALVHEAWFKLAEPGHMALQDRAHFLGVAARAMRQVLVDHARRVGASKRGKGGVAVDLDAAALAVDERADVLVALDEALERLVALSPRLARVVELRFFGGLTEPEIGELLGVTERTVRRDWVKARGWLHAEIAATISAG